MRMSESICQQIMNNKFYFLLIYIELQKDNSQISNLSLQVAYRNSLRMVDACDQLLAIYRQGSPETKLEVIDKLSYVQPSHNVNQKRTDGNHCYQN